MYWILMYLWLLERILNPETFLGNMGHMATSQTAHLPQGWQGHKWFATLSSDISKSGLGSKLEMLTRNIPVKNSTIK